MRKYLIHLACISLVSTGLAVPSAQELMERLADPASSAEAVPGSDWLASLSPEDSDIDRSSPEYAQTWAEAFARWAAYGDRDSGERDLAYLFPGPGAWSRLGEILSQISGDRGDPIRFQLAISEQDYEVAASFLGDSSKAPAENSSLIGRFFRLPNRGGDEILRFWYLRTAAFRSADAEFSNRSLEELLVFLANHPNGYFRLWGLKVPDLGAAFGQERAKTLLEGIFRHPEPQIYVSSFTSSDQETILGILIEGGQTNIDSFDPFLEPSHPGFGRAVTYLTEVLPGFPATDTRNDWIRSYLHRGEVENARAEFEAIREVSEREFFETLVKSSRGVGYFYERSVLYETVEPFLEGLPSRVRLEILADLVPLDSENDPVIAEIARQIEAEPDPSSELLFSRISRLFELGSVAEATAALQSYLNAGRNFQFPEDSGVYDVTKRYERLGRALWILEEEELFGQLLNSMDAYLESIPASDRTNAISSQVELLYELEMYEAAFEGAVELLELEVAQMRTDEYYWAADKGLVWLTSLYQTLGREEDALYLLHHSPFWAASSLSEVRGSGAEMSFPVTVAAIEAATGDSKMAVEILRDYIVSENRKDDFAYEALIELEGEAALPFFEYLIEIDPFEERPLIWKAVILLGQGRPEEAEKAARRAIAIDPTDGEMSARDRLRAYAVLGQALAAQGESEEADIMERIVAAVDLAEEADELRLAGMALPALRLYQESLEIFADAYCIQFRTAVELKAAGRTEEAEVHLRKAYGLMPHQFGRIESHCFGCEGAFRGEWEQDIAYEVFSEMIEEEPENPTLYYLLGYLEETRERDDEALKNLEKAVTLDPLYVNAWKKILSILDDRSIQDNEELREKALRAMLEYAPERARYTMDGLPLEWFPGLWDLISEATSRNSWEDEVPYPLGEKAAAVEGISIRSSRSYSSDPVEKASAGTIYWESTELLEVVRSSLR